MSNHESIAKPGEIQHLDLRTHMSLHRRIGIHVLTPSAPKEGVPNYAYVMGAFEAPRRDDSYIVEFEGEYNPDVCELDVRIIAYIDRYGRVFSQNEPSPVPPARRPDLMLTSYDERALYGGAAGAITVFTDKGAELHPAQYKRSGRFISITDSRYDFGPAAESPMSSDEALARAYLAFVYGPAKEDRQLQGFDLENIHATLENKPLVTALRAIRTSVKRAAAKSVFRPSNLAFCLLEWMRESGLSHAVAATMHLRNTQLSLINGTNYTTTYYVRREEDCVLPTSLIWKIESSLNRMKLVEEQSGIFATRLSMAECAERDMNNFKRIALQAPVADNPLGGQDGGLEWNVRCTIAESLERFRLPVRFESGFRVDLAAGVAAFELLVPDASMMPQAVWDDESQLWVPRESDALELQAERYAMHVGILAAASAFRASAAINRVVVYARPVRDEREGAEIADRFACVYTVEFTRAAFCGNDAYLVAAQGDPRPLYEACDAVFGGSSVGSAYDVVDAGPSAALRRDMLHSAEYPLRPASQVALGCTTTRDLVVNYRNEVRAAAEKLADAIVGEESLTACIAAARAVQNESNDPSVIEGCTRLMTALVEGAVDMHDQNAIVVCFMGRDHHSELIEESQILVGQGKMQEATMLVANAVDEAVAAGLFSDDGLVVRRVFGSEHARVIYNALRLGTMHVDGLDLSGEAGKDVELLSDSLYFCAIAASYGMEKTFGGTERALDYAKLCMRVGPTMPQGYLQAARIYMMMGDAESARQLLIRVLSITDSVRMTGLAYYQLGYVEWKSNHLESAVVCYSRAIQQTVLHRRAAVDELKTLMTEEGIDMVDRDDAEVLSAVGVPLAPTADVTDVLYRAAIAAVNENLFTLARPLLASALVDRPDDAQGRVLESLG